MKKKWRPTKVNEGGTSEEVRGYRKESMELLDGIADRVLAYRPKPKSAVAKKRQRSRRNFQKGHSNQ